MSGNIYIPCMQASLEWVRCRVDHVWDIYELNTNTIWLKWPPAVRGQDRGSGSIAHLGGDCGIVQIRLEYMHDDVLPFICRTLTAQMRCSDGLELERVEMWG